MKLIVGLGNPGIKYETTRHNIGFILADLVADKLDIDISKKGYQGLYGEGRYNGEKIIILKPQTYMNESGRSVIEAADYFGIDNEDIMVLFDDLDLDIGTIKVKAKGSSGGHNGIKSIISHLGDKDFPRVKLGISHPDKKSVVDYVLGTFSKEQWEKTVAALEDGVGAVMAWLDNGIDFAMNNYNKK